MATKLEIVNLALIELGENPVNTFDVANDIVQSMSVMYDSLADVELGNHIWHFALKWETLIEAPGSPPIKLYRHQYYLPADYIQAYDTYPWGDYNIATGNLVYSNNRPGWQWQYVAKVNEQEFPVYFADYLAAALAARCAMLVTQNGQIAMDAAKNAMARGIQAKVRDAKAVPSRQVRSDPILAAFQR
jgi:hypothetical protein